MNQQTITQLLTILNLTAAAIAGATSGETAEYAKIAGNVVAIAKLATDIHSQNSGLSIEQVVAQIHEIPGPQVPTEPTK